MIDSRALFLVMYSWNKGLFLRGKRSDQGGTSHLSEIHVILGVHQKDVPPE